MTSKLLKYNLGEGVCAFTTKRTLGRDKERICALLGIPEDHFVMPHQTHGTEIAVIDESNLLLPVTYSQLPEYLEGKDAIMTGLKGVLIGVSTADCIPVLLYDEEHHAIAAVHAGWKGTVKRIVEKSILKMQLVYGTRPESLKAIIGLGISQKNFEVGDEVYDLFSSPKPLPIEGRFNSDFCIEEIAVRYDKWHIDLKECNRQQMVFMGLRPENICVSPVCTYDDTEFFSARREQKDLAHKCGRNFNAIMIVAKGLN